MLWGDKAADSAVTLGWFVCLSECHHGDRPRALLEESIITPPNQILSK